MQRTVLIVDDEKSICQSLGSILTDEGYEVLTAASGEEALKIIKEELPSLVILDIWLPGIDGIETLKMIKSQYPQIRVIMISGHGTIETAVRATKLGAFDFIEKPLSLEKILISVANALQLQELKLENARLKEKREDIQWVAKSEFDELKKVFAAKEQELLSFRRKPES